MKVLFIHGWLHTNNMFDKYKDKYDCTFFEYNGLTNNKQGDLYSNLLRLKVLLSKEQFDVIVCHSLGSTLVYECLSDIHDATVILYSPFNNNLRKRAFLAFKLVGLLPLVRKLIKSKRLVKLGYSILLNEYDDNILDVAISGYYECNAKAAVRIIKQAFPLVPKRGISLQNKAYLVYGNNDTLTSINYDQMIKTFPNFKLIKLDCGHITPMHMDVDDILNDV